MGLHLGGSVGLGLDSSVKTCLGDSTGLGADSSTGPCLGNNVKFQSGMSGESGVCSGKGI